MIKDNDFMKVFHEAESKYGSDATKWPEKSHLVTRMRGSNPKVVMSLKHPQSSRLLLINYLRPGEVLGIYDSVEQAAEQNGVKLPTDKQWRLSLVKMRMAERSTHKVLIYENEACPI